MKWNVIHRHALSVVILLFYLLPLLLLTYYSIGIMARHQSWFVLSLGLLLSSFCALLLLAFLRFWENGLKATLRSNFTDFPNPFVPQPSVETEPKVTPFEIPASYLSAEPLQSQTQEASTNSREREQQLETELHQVEASLATLMEENTRLIAKETQTSQDFADYKLFSEEQLKQKNQQIASLQQNMEDQKTEMEKRQEQIQQLDSKVHDLSYEIKTLLYLNEADEQLPTTITPASFAPQSGNVGVEAAPRLSADRNVRTTAEATLLLRHCLELVQKLGGSQYYHNEVSRYREIQSSHYAIDQRRLFDSLKSQTSALVIVCSLKENKVIFANDNTKNLLGWTPEKFVLDFTSIFESTSNEWKEALDHLNTTPEVHVRLLAKTKHGYEIFLNCLLGVVPTGLFRYHVIGVLYPT